MTEDTASALGVRIRLGFGEVPQRARGHPCPFRFRDEVRRLTDCRGVDVVVHPVGGDRFTDSLRWSYLVPPPPGGHAETTGERLIASGTIRFSGGAHP